MIEVINEFGTSLKRVKIYTHVRKIRLATSPHASEKILHVQTIHFRTLHNPNLTVRQNQDAKLGSG